MVGKYGGRGDRKPHRDGGGALEAGSGCLQRVRDAPMKSINDSGNQVCERRDHESDQFNSNFQLIENVENLRFSKIYDLFIVARPEGRAMQTISSVTLLNNAASFFFANLLQRPPSEAS